MLSELAAKKVKQDIGIVDFIGVQSDTSTELCLRGNEVGGKV